MKTRRSFYIYHAPEWKKVSAQKFYILEKKKNRNKIFPYFLILIQ